MLLVVSTCHCVNRGDATAAEGDPGPGVAGPGEPECHGELHLGRHEDLQVQCGQHQRRRDPAALVVMVTGVGGRR